MPHSEAKQQLISIGREFYHKQWSVGTSSNYSVRLREKPLRVLITASGKDKGALSQDDFVTVDEHGKVTNEATPSAVTQESQPMPSAETMLHVVALRQPTLTAVLHTHSVWSTILSNRYASQGYVEISGYEMLKGLEGIKTHETTVRLKIFENTQDIAALSSEVHQLLNDPAEPLRYGFLLRRHGLYTWGKDLFAARRHVEIIEFLLEVHGRELTMR
jgi:methylthioribulose-1-phosphate dehydratase